MPRSSLPQISDFYLSQRCSLEELESRLLLAFSAHINFEPAGRPIPAGYTADTGLSFGKRGKGLSFGWNANNTASARDRNARGSPDQRYDTFNHLQRGGKEMRWEIAVPKGTYSVHIVAGDPNAIDSVYRINAEGTRVIKGIPTRQHRWIAATATVRVRDGRLTITNAKGSNNNKINFIDITEVVAAKPTVTIAATSSSVAEAGNDSAEIRVSRTGSTARALDVKLLVGGSAHSDVDYAAIASTFTIAKGDDSVLISLNPRDDQTQEGDETVTLTLQSSKAYTVGNPPSATITITDDDTSSTGNHPPPRAPVITEPLEDGENVSGADVHMEIGPFSDPDAGQTHLDTDWEIWTTSAQPVIVWSALGVTDSETNHHIHFGDGTFLGPQAGQHKLKGDTNYELHVRVRDNSGDSDSNTSPDAVRSFHTLPEETPTAAGWVEQQAGFKVEKVPFTFPAGEGNWRLPTNIVFVPDSVHRPHPEDPLFYVTELYGSIRVVTNNFTVHTYATGVLNYNPLGPFGGSGENGLTGIAIDPVNGDVYVTMLYDDPNDTTDLTFPKVTKYTSNDGGLTAVDTNASAAGTQGTDILKMPGEDMRQSHIISNITFGPDNKLWVHVGEGFESAAAGEDNRFKGKILHLNRNGSPATDNPHYDTSNGITAIDYWWAKGYRNPFGGAWRDADPQAGRPAQHYVVENGPSVDRFSLLVKGRDYLWDGSSNSILNFNIAAAPGGFVGDWDPSPAPVNIAFIQKSAFNGSGFPASKLDHAFVTLSGPTHEAGPNFAKSIQEWVLNNEGNRVGTPRELISYEGAGYATAAGLAAGPDGLYFTTLYPDVDANPTNRGAEILRIVRTGNSGITGGVSAARASDAPSSVAPLAVFSPRQATDWMALSAAPARSADRLVSFGDGSVPLRRNSPLFSDAPIDSVLQDSEALAT